ncbi:MAG: HNH endonuclease [Acidimicrobiia bacterium]|nr:HNH endonuclease [Acidimicrobiia bacterium]
MSVATRTRSPGPLAAQLHQVADTWARSQHRLVMLAARFADSHEWVVAGSPTAAHWLASTADVEVCTGREWIRIGRRLDELPLTADAFDRGELSYSKVRTLTRVATPGNEAELVAIAVDVPAGELGRAVAAWLGRTLEPGELAAHHHRQRSVRWRNEPDGMVTFTLRLPPALAGVLIAMLTTLVMKGRPSTTLRGRDASAAAWPTVAQQQADALEQLLTDGAGTVDTEVVLHVRGDGSTLDDGTPIPDSEVARLLPTSFVRALIHDAERRPINASSRQRHPTTRQKRVVKERDRVCVDCGRTDLLEYDHVPEFAQSGHTVIDELETRCAPCHHQRHRP